ncbi:acyl-CoA dehydrogenase [Sphingomonas sp. Root710]|nr:acyl-CoA dehydrogenase [Sphingomonas sp. Root710]
MELAYSRELASFKSEVEQFLEISWKLPMREQATDRKSLARTFRSEATRKGYLYRGIPKRYGGSEQAADPLRAQIIRDCFERARAPMEVPGNGVTMLTPTLLEAGAEWQREMFIPKTLTGEYRWAQGYSEPNAGSDLASLRSTAELVNGEWVINAHKIWTTHAYECTHMFILVRTEPDAPKHDGISYLLLKLDQPGVEIRRIHQISGQSDFCEVFLENVRTPADWIVGERGTGWQVSRTTLKHERNAIGGARTARTFASLVRLAQATTVNGRPAVEDPAIRDRILAVEGYVEAQLCSGYYQLTRDVSGNPAGILPLLNKLGATAIGKEIAAIATDIIAERALQMPSGSGSGQRHPEEWLNQIFGSLALTIAGGTSNIQRNVIAERGLGLPRDAGR